jgi:hypothetical protein
MAELVEGHIFALAHLVFGLFHESAFFGAENVIRINHALRLDEDAVLLLGERH